MSNPTKSADVLAAETPREDVTMDDVGIAAQWSLAESMDETQEDGPQ